MSTRHGESGVERRNNVLYVNDVMKILDVSQSKAYQIIRRINKELEEMGYLTISGRVSKSRFNEKFYA